LPRVTTPLHELAEQAGAALKERVRQLGPDAAKVADDIRRRQASSVNMKPSALRAFLRGEPCRNVFEWAEQEASHSGRDVDDLLRQELKGYYDRRLDFETRAGGGEHFHYCALNMGGMGAPRYGRYCVVDRRTVEDTAPDPVWVAEDSLTGSRFRDASGALLWDRLAEWVAPCRLAPELVALKLAGEPVEESPLQDRVCSDADYVEGLSVKPLAAADVSEIRSEEDDDLQARALGAAVFGAGPSEQLDLALHEEVRSLAADLGIRWASQ